MGHHRNDFMLNMSMWWKWIKTCYWLTLWMPTLARDVWMWHVLWTSIPLIIRLFLCKATLSGGDQGDVHKIHGWAKLTDPATRKLWWIGQLCGCQLGRTVVSGGTKCVKCSPCTHTLSSYTLGYILKLYLEFLQPSTIHPRLQAILHNLSLHLLYCLRKSKAVEAPSWSSTGHHITFFHLDTFFIIFLTC